MRRPCDDPRPRSAALALALVALAACRDEAGDDDGAAATDDAPAQGPLRLSFEELDTPDDFTLVTKFRFIPGTAELLALHKDGRVGHFTRQDDALVRRGEFRVADVHSDLDCGLLGLAFDPDFATNRFVYISTCISQTDSAVFRFTFDSDDLAATAASQTTILGAGDPAAPRPWHNVGEIGFDDTGALWALFGDKRVSSNGQNAANDLSALVRVIPNREPDGSGSTPAPDNPWPDDPDRSPNVYAIGLRSPWTGVYDHLGRWWFGDVGADDYEEVDVVTAPGQNFGWAGVEGPCNGDCNGTVPPVTSWQHDEITDYMSEDDDVRATVARTVYVGLQYQPRGADPYGGGLTNAVLFGDYCLGFVRAMELAEDGTVTRDEHMGHLGVPSGWDVGPDGYIYVSTFGVCETGGIDESDPPDSGFWRAVPAG